jgi:hypothetical protein
MADRVCDQCGKPLSDEDFKTGRAVQDRVDYFCAECHAMYLREEEERRKRKAAEEAERRREAEAARRATARPGTAKAVSAGGARPTPVTRRRYGPRGQSHCGPAGLTREQLILLAIFLVIAVVALGIIVAVVATR